MDTFLFCLDFTRGEEGGYTCDPKDSGNWSTGLTGHGRLIGSNMGVSAPTLISWLDRDAASSVDSDLMRALPEATYQAIARARYWRSLNCDEIAPGIALMIFDHGWNVGVGKSARCLQTSLDLGGELIDGDVGVRTLGVLATPAWPRMLDMLDKASIRQLQASCSVEVDGKVGPNTTECLQRRPDLWPLAVIYRLRLNQAAIYRQSTNFQRYGKGWLARTDRRCAAAQTLLNAKGLA